MKFTNKLFFQTVIFSFCYGVIFYILQFFFARTGMFSIIPNAMNIHNWDVGYYESIKRMGYDGNSHNTGFFILFPLIWKISHLGVWGICALNTIFFSLGFAVLMRTLGEKNKLFWLLCLTLPSVYFAFIPYTESLFFLFSSLLFYSVRKDKFRVFWVSLLLISLVRATAIFLLPALLAMELLSNPRNEFLKSSGRFIYKSALPTFIGLGIFILIQYYETGIWFAYFKTQAEHWGHVFTWTGLPFTNIEGAMKRYHWLSALAIFLNFFAFTYLIRYFWGWIKDKKSFEPNLVFSLGYLTMLLLSLIFMNPKYGNHTTNIMGANRYTFISPFFFFFLHFLFQQKFSLKQIAYVFIFLNAFLALTFGAYRSLNIFIEVGLMPCLLLLSFMFYAQNTLKNSWLLFAIMAFDFFAQMHFFQQFITPLYVD